MSRPRLLRTETLTMPIGEHLREGVDALVGRAIERNAGRGIERNQVDLGLDARQQPRQPPRILGESLTPSSITYSNVIRLRFFSGNRRHASRMSCSEYFFVGGTMAAR